MKGIVHAGFAFALMLCGATIGADLARVVRTKTGV
jgi:hypothetical protein